MPSSAESSWPAPFGIREFPYQLHRLSKHCLAFVEPHGLSNVGVVESDEGLLLIDSTIHPYFIQEMLKQLRRALSKPILYLLNTHFHRDHTFGNLYVEVEVGHVAHALCSEYFERYAEGLRSEYEPFHPGLGLRSPTIVFPDSSYVVPDFSPEVHVHLIGGHTHDSCYVHVPHEGVVFAGDAVFNKVPPYLAQWSCVNHFGKIGDWISGLEEIGRLKPQHVVAGHGELAESATADELRKFFEYYASRVEEEVRKGTRLKHIWDKVFRTSDFLRPELEPEVYLHLVMGLFDEFTGPPTLYEK